MRNAINDTRMAKRNLIGKNILKATALVAIFIFVFAFVCGLSNANLVSLIQNGTLNNVAYANWTHPGSSSFPIVDSNSGGKNVTALATMSSLGTYYFYDTGGYNMGHFGIFMSDGSSGDCKSDNNTVAIDQGNSQSLRYGMVYGAAPLSKQLQMVADNGALKIDFNALWEGGNSSYCSYGIFAYCTSSSITTGTEYAHTTFKSSILNSSNGYNSMSGIPDHSWNSSHSDFVSKSITGYNAISGTKSIVFGGFVSKSKTSGLNYRQMEISMGKPTVTLSKNESTAPTISVSGNVVTISDAGAGVKSVTIKKDSTTIGTYDWTTKTNATDQFAANTYVAATSFSSNTRSISFTIKEYGSYTFSATDNVGNSMSDSTQTINVPYPVTLAANSGTLASSGYTGFASYSAGSGTVNYGTTCYVPNPSRTGYTFVGWKVTTSYYTNAVYGSTSSPSTSINADTLCYGGSSGTYFKNLSIRTDSTATLTAQWKKSDFGVLDGKSRTDGTWGQSANPFVIDNYDQLYTLARIVNGDDTPVDSVTGHSILSITTNANKISYDSCYFLVRLNDGALSTSLPITIGKDSTNYFGGNIYGGSAANTYAEKTIPIAITSATNYCGLFGYIKGTESVRASVRYLKTSGSVSASGKSYVGGVCGYAVYTDFENCANTASITAGDNNGGVFGYILATTTLKGTFSNTGSVSGSTGSGYVGGICGDCRSTLTNCTFTNTGSVTASGGYVGGIFGKLDAQNKANSKILSASNTATISASGKTYVGGIIGIADNVTIQGATNSGAVTGGQYTGGIFGKIATSTLTGSYTTTGSNIVTGTTSYVGGIAGYIDGVSNSASSITASNTMRVSASGAQYTAGIAGYVLNLTITSGSNTGNITGGSHTAGIFGHSTNTVIMNGTFTNGTNGSSVGTINGTGGMCGGIGGQTHAALKSTSTFANYGSVTGGGDSVGGLFGFLDNLEANIAMRNAGAVTGTTSLGGIVGRAQRGLVATNIYAISNSGTITSNGGTTSSELGGSYTAVGGIAGYINNNIEKATNTGAVTVASGKTASAVGGIVGINHNGYSISILNCTNSGAITSGGNFTGGIVGRLNASSSKNITGCSNTGNVSGAANVGGIAGYLNNYSIVTSCSNTGTVTGTGDSVGGFIGEANAVTISINILSNSKAITGASYVGGIIGKMNSACDFGTNAFSNSGQVKGTSYVGGIFGYCPGVTSSSGANSLHNLTNTGVIIGSTSYVGGLIGNNAATINGTLSNTANVYGYSSAATGTRTAKFVGGLIGYNKGNISSITIGNISSAINVTGAGYVGGLFGATYGSRIAIGTSNTIKINLYGGGDSSHNYGYIGGVFGYVAGTGAETTNTTLDPGTSTNNYFRFTTSSFTCSFNVSGYGSYVGKIAGYATGISIENLSSNDASVALTNATAITATDGNCVGGIVGYLANCAIHQESITPTTSKSAYFGYVGASSATSGTSVQPGSAYYITISYTVESTNYSVDVYFSPSIQGTVTTLPTYNPSSNTFTNVVITETNEFITSVGGVTPNAYIGTSIYGRYGNSGNISAKSYVGGIIGKIDSGVGNLESGTRGAANSIYYLGGNQKLYLENTGTITSSYYYVGGLIGGLANTTGSAVLHTFLYAHLANKGTIGTSGSTSFVGGLIGAVGTAADIDSSNFYVAAGIDGTTSFNVADGSYNGDSSTQKTIQGKYYVGGAVGFMGSNPNNYIDSFLNVALVTSSSGYYIGGIVGYMGAGRAATNGSSLNKCVSTPTGTISGSTSFCVGTMYVGGICGQAGNVAINGCYTMGFGYSVVNANNGGICGNVMPGTSIIGSWAILYVNNLSYTVNYSNSNGNFIMVGANTNWKIPSYAELLYEAGLTNSAIAAGNYVSATTNTTPALGYITLKLAIPGVGGGTNENYIAFFTGNGNREPSDNLYTNYTQDIGGYAGYIYNDGSNMCVKTYLAQASSYSVCYETAQFVNVESTDPSAYTPLSTAKKIENWTTGFNNGRFSDQYIAEFSSAPSLSGSTFTVACNVFYKNLFTGYVSDKWLAGVINKSFSSGTSTLPYTISTQQQWNNFAGWIRDNNSTYMTAYFKVLKDINLGTYNSSSNNFLVGNTTYAFRGTLDGNGKTITYTYTNAGDDTGLFPRIGSGAILKNIRLAGTLTSSGKGIGALIGSAQNACTIQNVRSSVAVTGTFHVGGLIGYVAANINLKDIALTGTVRGNTYDSSGGTGGIIGTVYSGTTTIDSARNAGTVYGEANAGGVIGYVNGTATITNSCNTGRVEEITRVKDRLSYVGGICGKVTKTGGINIYACYNSGIVWGKCARVGGLIGCDTDDVTSSSGRTKVYYSFNAGHVYSGHYLYRTDVEGGNNTFTYWSGGECGGLVGMAIAVDMYYCYNIGTVTSFGVASHLYENQSRTGGLIGLMYNYQNNYYCTMKYCYNAGLVQNRCTLDNVVYMSGLVGCCIYERTGWWILDLLKYWSGANNLPAGSCEYNYSMYGQCDLGHKTGTVDTLDMTRGSTYTDGGGYIGVAHNYGFLENYRRNGYLYFDFIYWAQNWTIQDTLVSASQMVCGYDASAQCGSRPSGMSGWTAGGSYGSTAVLRNSSITSNSSFGYIYIPGCLPQLSIFAVDTESGVAMTGSTSGFNTETQEYELKSAGTEYSPYVIQNGIDLLGLSQLIAINDGYHATNKYYAFANGFNNLDGRNLDSGINMNTFDMSYSQVSYEAFKAGSDTKDYLVYSFPIIGSNGTTSHGTQSFYQSTNGYGKNRLLFRNSSNNVLAGTATNENFNQIASTSGRYFSGTLDGYKKTVNGVEYSYPVIKNLKIKRTSANDTNNCYAAFIGYGSDCTVRNFTIEDPVISVSGSVQNSFVAAFVAKAMGRSTLSGLVATSSSNSLIITNATTNTYAGGICAYASPNTSVTGGYSTHISDCKSSAVVTVNITGTTNSVGGILGYANGVANRSDVGVFVDECSVTGGTLTNASTQTNNIGTGGIVGYRNTIGRLDITNCEVGTGSANVTIKGNHTVGGIISRTNGETATHTTNISNCTVGAKTTICKERTNAISTTQGTAFGGFIGYAEQCKLTGTNTFSGTIKVGTTGAYVAGQNIGGLIGYLGSGTKMQGNINIDGTIDAGSTIASNTASSNIGGAIGYVPAGSNNIDGQFYINPQMTTTNSTYVGGFIGYNNGSLYILGSSSIIDLTGSSTAGGMESQMALDENVARATDVTINTITAKEYVGGFIGRNNGTIYVGSQKDLDDQDSIGTFTAYLVAKVNGNRYVGGFVGYNNGTITTDNCKANVTNAGDICNAAAYKTSTEIGGIVGYNAAGASFAVEEQENYFANSGTIGYNTSDSTVQYAGGVVGYNAGSFTNIGTLANTGAIYGNQYVAGSIGYFQSGSLYGTMINGVAQTSSDGDTVSRSYSTTVTRITAGTTALSNPTTIALEQEVTQGNNYKYSIGKVTYYFTSSISGTIKGFENENVTILGKQKLTTSTNLIVNTNNITANSTVLSPTITYNYQSNSVSYYYYSTVYGMVQSVLDNTITIYPTLQAEVIGSTSGYTSLNTSVNKAMYTYTSGSTYGFDGTDLIGTVAYKTNTGAVAFSALQIEASREPLTGTMTAYEGLRITKDNKYKFYVGTVPYFFTAKVTGVISNIIGNVLTISSYTEEAYGRVDNGSSVRKGHYYVLNNGSEYYFYATVDGTISSIASTMIDQGVSVPAVAINTTIETSRSAIASPTDLGIGGGVVAGTNYMFVYNSTNYYFTAPYTGDLTYLGHDGTGVKYGITNTDYTDMLASSRDADSHSGYVSGVTNIGGVVSVVNQATTVGVYKEGGNFVPGVYTRLINFGTVQSTSGENVGGSIGQMAGTITGETINSVTQYVEFFNYGTVNVVKNGGGCIGIFSGNGTLVQMFNYQNTNIYDAAGNMLYENIGGCIGLVTKPASGYVVLRNAIIVNSGVVRAYTTRTGVTGTGFGGVIGTIADNAVQTEANWSVDLYSDGSVYCGTQANGQSNAGQFSRVGGLIGAIGSPTGAGAPIVLKSVLNYTKRSGTGAQSTVTAVSGYDYVGGILGLNNSSITAEGVNASVRYCYNVGGEVWGHYSSGTVGGIIGSDGSNHPNTYCCYWISAFENSALQNAKVNSLGTTLTRSWTTAFTAQDVTNGIYSPETWEEYFTILKAYLGNGGVASGYFTDGIDDYYLENYTYELQEEILDENDEVIGYNYSYIDFYDIFFTNNYLTIKEAAQNYYNDILNGGLDITTIETDTDIPIITTIHDVNSATQSIREKGEAEFEDLQEVVVAYLDPMGTHTFEENDIGDYGFYESASEGTKSYSTGSVKTGFFFAYAHDELPKYSDREIETEHTRAGAVADYDLRMWKYISQAYGNTETNNSISNIIYNYAPSSTDSSGYVDKSGSSATLYHIYARAFMPTIGGNPTGYYLFAQAQVSSGLVVSYNAVSGQEAFYIDADSAVCQNVLIFYKQVAVTTKLTYNGLERSAPIAGLTATESKTSQASYYSFNNHAAVNGITFNTGINVGLYYLDASIYYIPDNAYIFSTGSGNTGTQINITTLTKAQETKLIPGNSYYYTIDATSYTFSIPNSITFPNVNSSYPYGYGWLNIIPTAGGQKVYVVCPVLVGQAVSDTTVSPVTYTWKISERKLTAVAVNKNKTSGGTAIYYDKDTHSVTLTISNVVSGDTIPGTYTTENALKALQMYFKLTLNPSISAANTNSWICSVETPSQGANITSSRGYSSKDGGYCTSITTYQVMNYVYTLSAVNAGTYTIKAEKDNSASKANNYSMSSTMATLIINKKVLTASWIGNETVEFDGANHTLTLQISGWAAGESVGSTSATGTVLNWVNSASYTSSGLTKGTLACSNQNSGNTTTSSVVSIPFSAKNKGSYYVKWSTLTFGGNYTLAAGQTDTLSITAMVLIVTVQSAWGTDVYDGTDNHEYKLRITSQNDNTVTSSLITEILGKVKGNTTYYDNGTGATNSKTKNSETKVNITVTFKAKHAGGYKFGLDSIAEGDGNYGMTAYTSGARQTISKKALSIAGKNTAGESYSSGTYNYVYNQAKQGLGNVSITGFVNSTDASSVLSGGMNNAYTNVTPTMNASGTTITYTFGVANVGNYYAGIGLRTSHTTASNYTLTSGTWTWNITSVGIRCTWSGTTDYVYTGAARTRPLSSIAIYNGETVISGLETITPTFTSASTQTFNVTISGSYVDTLTLTLVTTEAINVGVDYTCSVSSFTLTGTNAGGDSIDDNYVLTSASTTFNIVKSKVYVDESSAIAITKVYDNTLNMPEGVVLNNVLTLSFASSNGGATNPGFSVNNAYYDNVNVGIDKNITYVLNLGNTNNYEWRNSSTDRQIVINNGEITQKQLQIIVYKKGTDLTKVYDNNEYFGGAAGAVYSSGTTVKSATYRSGNGFEVRNIVSSEEAGDIIVTAVFQEVDRTRAAFDKYVNNVENNNGTYTIITPSPSVSAHYKQIVFTLSGDSAPNYSLALSDGGSTITTSSSNIITYADNANATMHVSITKYTVNVTYGNTYQSYAQTKNEYTYENVGWFAVTAELPTNSNVSNSLAIAVTNTWMYENHVDMTDGWARIVTYTRLTGGPGKYLNAVLGGPNGIALNYNIKAQPVLVIDYFISTGENYEITTLAGLMLATYYYKNYATLGEDDKVYTYSWVPVCNDSGYEAYIAEHPTVELEFDPATNYWGYWDAVEVIPDKYDKFILNADISGIMTTTDYDILKNAFGTYNNMPVWGYGMGHTINSVYVTYLENFIQTKVGEEVIVIGNFFADEFDGTFDGNGYVIKDFTQVFNVTVPTRAEINIGFFGKIANLANVSNMSLREYKLYVYDYTGLGNTLNIGSLVGLSVSSFSMTNTTVHASVNVDVSGSGSLINAGIVMGRYEGTITGADESGNNEYEVNVAVENVIALGNIIVNNENGSALVGGVLGSIGTNSSNGSALFGAVSFADVNAIASTVLAGGLIGYAGSDTSISITPMAANPNCFTYLNSGGAAIYLANSTVYKTNMSEEWTVSNLAIGNVNNSTISSTRQLAGTSYTNIMNNSNTAYTPKFRPDSTTSKGSFDIISEVTVGGEAKYKAYVPGSGGVISAEPRESFRLSDMIKTYILKFAKTETTLSATIESVSATLNVYQLATSNTMLGSSIGTTSSKIALSYAQHTTMLRMFRFAEFELKKQINLPVNNYNIVYSGVFYGNVSTTTVQVISTSSYTTRKIGNKTYATLADYKDAYEAYYNVTLTTSGGYYVYTPSIYVYIKESAGEKMFEKEINTIPINGVVNE